MKIYFFLFFFSVQALAIECHDAETPLIMFRQDVLNVLPNKKCPTDDEAILKQVEDEYKKFYGKETQVKKSVKGSLLKASAKEIQLANKMLGAKPPKEWDAAAKGCETLQCAFGKILKSKEAAMQLFNIHAKSNYLLSLDQTINQNKANQIWSPKEIRELDAAISKLPPELTDLPHFNLIERMADGYRRSTSSSSTAAFASPRIKNFKEAELVIYDSGLSRLSTKNPYLSTSWPQEVLIHEICHHYDFKGYYTSNEGKMTTEQKSSAFSKLSNWKRTVGPKGEETWKSSSNAQFVSDYAATQPAEDFAETCSNYVLHPEKLKAKAPAKYAFMKKNVFNNKEFNDKPWTSGSKSWSPLTALLQDEKGCHEKLAECVHNIQFSGDNFCQSERKVISHGSMTTTSCGSISTVLNNNTCFNDFKNDRLNELEEILQAEESYCKMNGPALISGSKDKICGKAVQELTSQLEKASKHDLNAEVSSCESAKDYTKECIKEKLLKKLKTSPDLLDSVGTIIDSLVPNRMIPLSQKLSAMSTGQWLKPCLNVVNKIKKYQTTTDNVTKNNYYYESSSEEFASGFLADHIYPGYKNKDINMACSLEMLKILQTEGYKTSPSVDSIQLMNDSIKAEIRSYEENVLGKIEDATKGCLLPSCKVNKINDLLLKWEKEAPTKRKGFATKEYAKELRKKFSSF